MSWFLILLLALGAALIYAKFSYKPNVHELAFKKEFDAFKKLYAVKFEKDPDLLEAVESVEVKALVFCAQKPQSFPDQVDYKQRTYDLVLTYLISKLMLPPAQQKVAAVFTTDKSKKYIDFYQFLLEDALQKQIISKEQYERGQATLKDTLNPSIAKAE